jgi:UDP-N-acetylmuramate--alanine ligase
MYNKIKRIHLIGVGGIGMSGIAELLVRNGYNVSGSDLNRGEAARQLEKLGVRIFAGHEAGNVEGAELVVYSSAIRPENPEVQAAQAAQIPLIPRAEMLAELMRIKYGIAVAGAHGKTTTTSMVAMVLTEAGLDPTIVVGGRMDNFGGTNARLGLGEFMVVEADESDGSFNKLSPSIAVVTNMDREHMDHYQTMPRLKKAFLSFLNKVPFYGLAIICHDDPYLKLLSHRIERRKKTYGFREGSNYRLTNYEVLSTGGSRCTIEIGNHVEQLRLQVPGRHNMLNAVAALAVADELSVPRARAIAALEAYQGVQRRFQKRGKINGVLFIDDYAHHPSEISATLAAAREQFPNSGIRVVFQPHRYSRVEDLLDQFAGCFKACDSVAITDIYAAGEARIPGVDSEVMVDAIRRQGQDSARYAPSPMEGIENWMSQSTDGDVIITLGAGDLPNVYKQLF